MSRCRHDREQLLMVQLSGRVSPLGESPARLVCGTLDSETTCTAWEFEATPHPDLTHYTIKVGRQTYEVTVERLPPSKTNRRRV